MSIDRFYTSKISMSKEDHDSIFKNKEKPKKFDCMECQDKGFVLRTNNMGGAVEVLCRECRIGDLNKPYCKECNDTGKKLDDQYSAVVEDCESCKGDPEEEKVEINKQAAMY